MSTLDISNESIKTSEDILSSNIGIIAKLRRIKIQEDLMIQNVKKNSCEPHNGFIKYDLEYKKYISKLKTSYADIKQLFDDLKCVTKTSDTLQKLDIDEVKKDVLDLEEKISSLKTFLQRELAILKSTEQHLVIQINEEENQNAMVRKQPKIHTKSYSDIIPSPVRNLINSPFKYPEVQQFQDFLSQSNKHGGWNEYNHNIFIKLWQKHFQTNEDDFHDNLSYHSEKNNLFINDVSENISGVKKADIISHMEWYNKYLSLKKRQQLAIDEWRAKTRPKKAFQQSMQQPSSSRNEKEKVYPQPFSSGCPKKATVQKCKAELSSRQKNDGYNKELNDPIKEVEQDYSSLVDANEFLKEMEKTHGLERVSEFRYTKSTKQWKNRCYSSADKEQLQYNDLDCIIKLGIPSWRSRLMKDDD
ncbi:hypothetical protein ABMA27_006110 [Loxostege sticticalis]|uniref:Uncharacterized protein n=1 Tax=Loxostege sticticalis TaxID=481309 RepID=A0ABR3HHM6_LOXSC